MLTDRDLRLKGVQYRKDLLRLIKACGSGHTGGDLSCIDIVNVLYNRIMRGSRRGVVFANRAEARVRHEKGVARQQKSGGVIQSRDKVGVNRGSRGGVVCANLAHAEAGRRGRHEEVVARFQLP
jgi:hypothetical protein